MGIYRRYIGWLKYNLYITKSNQCYKNNEFVLYVEKHYSCRIENILSKNGFNVIVINREKYDVKKMVYITVIVVINECDGRRFYTY